MVTMIKTGQLQSPAYLARRALRTALYPKGDPALRQATPKSLGPLSLEDVTAYYRQVFRPEWNAICARCRPSRSPPPS